MFEKAKACQVLLAQRIVDDARYRDWVDIETLIGDGDDIEVRGRRCTAMVKVWRSHSLGGAEVLARSKSGKT